MPAPELIPGNAISRAIAQATGADVVDSNFQMLVVNALLKKGLDTSAITPSILNQIVTALWNNPTIQDAWITESSPDSTAFLTDRQFESEVSTALFSPSNSPDPAIARLGVGLLSSQRRSLTTEQQAFVVTGTGNANDVRNIIIQVALEKGVDPSLALAIADQESGLNPNAVGDNGHSVGLFQLHDQGEGAGMTVQQREDPRANAEIALSQVALVAQQHPDWTPGQIAAAAQRPADQASYAASIDAIYGNIKGGQLPTPKFGQAPGSAGVNALSSLYPGVESAFESYFKRKPTFAELSGLTGLDTQQLEDALRAMPSHIAGLTMGQYTDLRALADKTMQGLLGHAATDGIVKELFDNRNTTPGEVEHYLNHISETALHTIDPKTYNTIYAANQPAMQGIYGETGFDPRIAAAQYQQAASTTTDSSKPQVAPSDAAASADQSPVRHGDLPFDPTQNQPASGAALFPGTKETPPPPAFPPITDRREHGAFA